VRNCVNRRARTKWAYHHDLTIRPFVRVSKVSERNNNSRDGCDHGKNFECPPRDDIPHISARSQGPFHGSRTFTRSGPLTSNGSFPTTQTDMPGGMLGTARPLGQKIRSVLGGHWLASAKGCAGVPFCVIGGTAFETVPVISSLARAICRMLTPPTPTTRIIVNTTSQSRRPLFRPKNVSNIIFTRAPQCMNQPTFNASLGLGAASLGKSVI